MSRAGFEAQYWAEMRESEQREIAADERARLSDTTESLIRRQTEKILAKQEGRLPAWTSMRAVAAQSLDFDVDYIKAGYLIGEYSQDWFKRAWGIRTYDDPLFTPLGEVEDQAMHLLFLAAAVEAGDLEVGGE